MPALQPDPAVRPDDIAQARSECLRLLASVPHRSFAAALACAAEGYSTLLGGVEEAPQTHRAVARLVDAVASSPADRAPIVRTVLVSAAVAALDRLPDAPLPQAVVSRFCEEFAALARGADVRAFEIGSSRFARACKLATLRRFPAGQFEWERSGISRRDLLRVRPGALPNVLATVAWRMRGLGPVFFSHLNPRRPNRALDEREANRSYYLMAMAMEQQPDVIGFAACSWFRSPATHAVSPHLAWLSRVFLENGGVVAETGRADADCGIFHRSATRRRLYEEGRFRPTLGLVLWPRRAMLAWARAHPELAA
jgi:hypothetical protein